MNAIQAQCIHAGGAVLAEGPVWHGSRLWYVDIERREVHRLDPATGADASWTLPGRVGFAVPSSRGDWIVGMESVLARLDPSTGAVTPTAHPEGEGSGNRFNDAKCGPDGRLWAGTMALDERPGRGSLYCIDGSWQARRKVSPVSISNGLGWSPDGRVLYYVDSPTRRVDAFDYRDGEISGRRTVATFAEGFPDGLCVDASGNLWVALWGGWCVACVDPRTGEQRARVEVSVEAVTSCCFGDGDALYITTASRDLDAAGRARQPLAGGIFRARVGVEGIAGEPHLFREP